MPRARQIAPKTFTTPPRVVPRSRPRSPECIDMELMLFDFLARRSRGLESRGRRHLQELVELISDHFAEHQILRVSATPLRGAVSLPRVMEIIDDFERNVMPDLLGGERERTRSADATLRALSRQLSAQLRQR